MTDDQLAKQRTSFLAYLKGTFGEEFIQQIDEPEGLQIGERVLYRLAGRATGTRREPSERELDRIREQMTHIAGSTGASAVTFTVVNDNGKRVDFYTAWPMHIDGRSVKCSIAPTETFKPDPRYCPDWPSDIRLGHTKVEVIYWSSARDGEPVLVSDAIRKLP